MSENYIVINGKKAELTPEQLKALGLETETNPFERVKRNGTYYAIAGTGKVGVWNDYRDLTDDNCYNVGNYCTDKEILQQRAYVETLNRLLWRYSMEHKGNEMDWNNNYTDKHYVYYDHLLHRWSTQYNNHLEKFGSPYFLTREIAKNAIKEIVEPFMAEHPDFKL